MIKENQSEIAVNQVTLRQIVTDAVNRQPVTDIHTHLFSPEFGRLNLFGIDELLTYHYLVAEMFRLSAVTPDEFWKLDHKARANVVWQTLFVRNSPISEAALGVITVLKELGLDTTTNDLDKLRRSFADADITTHTARVLEIANVSTVVMTNDPFDVAETTVWESGITPDPRFRAAIRLDRLLNDWPSVASRFQSVTTPTSANLSEIRSFLERWTVIMKPVYLAVSLPDDFDYFTNDLRNTLIRDVVLPLARDFNLPLALMIGVRRGVNPALRLAGDGVGRADIRSLEKICLENPDVRFLATFLSRENQHELCVAARKFPNLTPFGCWWFLNNPSIIREITHERFELLGTSFIPQHSDARVLDQLIYKWKHSRTIIADVLAEHYGRLAAAGRIPSIAQIERDVQLLFAGNFERLTGRPDTRTAENHG